MRVGDLVRMKYEKWAVTKARMARTARPENMGIVYSIAARGVKVLMPDGSIKLGLVSHWEVMSNMEDLHEGR